MSHGRQRYLIFTEHFYFPNGFNFIISLLRSAIYPIDRTAEGFLKQLLLVFTTIPSVSPLEGCAGPFRFVTGATALPTVPECPSTEIPPQQVISKSVTGMEDRAMC